MSKTENILQNGNQKINFLNFNRSDKRIFIAQVISVSLIWVFVIGISVWILNLLSLSLELHDVPGASVGISIVAIPVFVTLACILTYVFIGLKKVKK